MEERPITHIHGSSENGCVATRRIVLNIPNWTHPLGESQQRACLPDLAIL